MTDQNDDTDNRYREQEYVFDTYLRPRLERAEKLYNQALTSLWFGNGAAALASLSFIGAASSPGNFPHKLMMPFGLFVVGLISMGIGSGATLVAESIAIRRLERAESFLDLNLGDFKSPTEKTGLTFNNWRTCTALISAICFVSGCIVGLRQLTCSN